MKRPRFRLLSALAAASLAWAGTGAQGALLINELDSDSVNPPSPAPADPLEFVEIYDTSGTSVPLDGYVLVFFNGGASNANRAYRVEDLDGYSTSATGYFVAGSIPGAQLVMPGNTIQNGVDAIGLYVGNAADFTTGNTTGTLATTTNLVDAIVYKTGADTDGVGLAGLLGMTGPDVDEFGRDGTSLSGSLDSIGRLPNGSGAAKDSTSWTFMTPTPGAANGVVPEPASLLLATLSCAAIVALRRR